MPLSLIIIVAAIQGVTEFLPVSSSGHLALIPIITAHPYQGQTIDVAAHVGTLVAVLFYLRQEISDITAATFSRVNSVQQTDHRRLGLMIIGATIPVALVGFTVNYADWHWLTLMKLLHGPISLLPGFCGSLIGLADSRTDYQKCAGRVPWALG